MEVVNACDLCEEAILINENFVSRKAAVMIVTGKFEVDDLLVCNKIKWHLIYRTKSSNIIVLNCEAHEFFLQVYI